MAPQPIPRRLPRGSHRLTRDQVVASQRTRMLEAMADAAAEKGYVNTTVADVIRGAGVSRETFYQQFADKHACFLAAYDAAVHRTVTTMNRALGDAGDDPLDRFERGLDAYLGSLREHPARARTFMMEVYAVGPEALARRTELQARVFEIVAGIFGARSEQELFACEALVAAIGSLVTNRIGAGQIAELPALRQPLMGLVRAALERRDQP